MPFRFSAKHVLLTYSQCGELDPHSVVCHLADLGAECIIGRETHSDGGLHLHAFAMFGRKFSSRNERIFDVGGRHPNIQNITVTPEKAYDYAIKDGEVVGGGLERPSRAVVSNSSEKWAAIVAAETRDDFFRLAGELDPKALCCSFTSLRTYADWRYREDAEPYSTPGGISFDTDGIPELDDWVSCNLVGNSVGMSFSN